MSESDGRGLVRPQVEAADAERIAAERYGIRGSATELGSNQDRNFVLETSTGTRSVMRIDNPIFTDDARDAQHAALEAYRHHGISVPSVLPGLDGELTQRWEGYAVRLSEFADGTSFVDAGYLAPVVLRGFGTLAADAVVAVQDLTHPGLARDHMWDLRVAYRETLNLAASIADEEIRQRVLTAAESAHRALSEVADALPTQALHGDITDDNVMGTRGQDGRLHPTTLIDFGDLSYGWRVAELAVTASSMLHHEPARPLRVLETISAFHARVPLTAAEARAVWPLIVLRAALLVASGWRQLEIDGENEYARERIAGEQAIFDSATSVHLHEATEQVLHATDHVGIAAGTGLRLAPSPEPARSGLGPLRALIPSLDGPVEVLDPGVESVELDAGRWLDTAAESELIGDALQGGAAAAVFPYGLFRLTRTLVDAPDAAETWPIDTEIWLPAGGDVTIVTPREGTIAVAFPGSVTLQVTDTWLLTIVGIEPVVAQGDRLEAGDKLGTVRRRVAPRSVTVGLSRIDAMLEILADGPVTDSAVPGRAQLVAPERVPAWARFTHDPAALIGLESRAQRDTSGDEQARRERIFASAQERYYERPMQVQRGWRHHLVDTTGRSYVDMVNNVTGLGHGHPGVADAINRQSRILGTNSRFLYRELAEYSERLLALLPAESKLDTVLLVNSGSEAVDLALRLAQAATGRQTVVALREAYHGWTMASDAVTTSAFDNPHALSSRPEWVHVADVPNQYRGTYRGAQSGPRYAADLGADLDSLAADGRPVAGFICESVLGNAGGVLLPDGYLADVYHRVRKAGGLCIADEVQVGFGRMGSSFWGFEQSGVLPDIITIAKPMGNGFPIGGVITTQEIADSLAEQGQFFSSAGGNPVSCAVGIAVLDAMRSEELQENAHRVGQRLVHGFQRLAERHALIGPIHGEGLYLGVELVKDRETMEPATAEAEAICERLRELGVIVLTTSERSNVLKVKPPLCLTEDSADFVLNQLDRVLTEGW